MRAAPRLAAAGISWLSPSARKTAPRSNPPCSPPASRSTRAARTPSTSKTPKATASPSRTTRRKNENATRDRRVALGNELTPLLCGAEDDDADEGEHQHDDA